MQTQAEAHEPYPAVMLYGCAVGFSWADVDASDGDYLRDYWPDYGVCLIGECMFENIATRPVTFAAAWAS